MKQTKIIMGMPITVEIVDDTPKSVFTEVFDYFRAIDKRFSTYKNDSEISKVNRGLNRKQWSKDMNKIISLCELTKQETNGYFDIEHNGSYEPSGLVKGWSIWQACKLLESKGIHNFSVEAGGDIQVKGKTEDSKPWTVGIRNPFNIEEIVKVVSVTTEGVASSGTYVRGQHIYNPFAPDEALTDVASLTVIGPNIYEADRFATAAFAMGISGIEFIEEHPDLEGYMITNDKKATLTSGFERYEINA